MSFHKNRKKLWEHVTTGPDGNCILFGVNIFEYEWNDTDEKVIVADPQHHQTYHFSIYTACIEGSIKRFAAGEFSNCVWGFFIERDDA